MAPFSIRKTSPESLNKSIPRGINFLIDFWMDFSLILARSWDSTWSHVGHFFAENAATLIRGRVFFVGSLFFSRGTLGYPIGPWPESDGVPLLGLVFGSFFLMIFGWFPAPILPVFQAAPRDGLVGLREAQRIYMRHTICYVNNSIFQGCVGYDFGMIWARLLHGICMVSALYWHV